ncbi:hypothetical protein N7471_012489 [Penicillium samsonianum]|uniref:uncharacterized protein n=1 Tax=Penicillium samsonianum TaxID=1882272 RepID=UPI0025486BA2|nr:uncharacterized protein N7471_012489 [Penicillium samsonianum]KAJ6125172.1 hypothetical protein N7471_012489 [Penicillium samsonianum]
MSARKLSDIDSYCSDIAPQEKQKVTSVYRGRRVIIELGEYRIGLIIMRSNKNQQTTGDED